MDWILVSSSAMLLPQFPVMETNSILLQNRWINRAVGISFVLDEGPSKTEFCKEFLTL